jgi:hypothetical protein
MSVANPNAFELLTIIVIYLAILFLAFTATIPLIKKLLVKVFYKENFLQTINSDIDFKGLKHFFESELELFNIKKQNDHNSITLQGVRNDLESIDDIKKFINLLFEKSNLNIQDFIKEEDSNKFYLEFYLFLEKYHIDINYNSKLKIQISRIQSLNYSSLLNYVNSHYQALSVPSLELKRDILIFTSISTLILFIYVEILSYIIGFIDYLFNPYFTRRYGFFTVMYQDHPNIFINYMILIIIGSVILYFTVWRRINDYKKTLQTLIISNVKHFSQ